MNFNAKEVRLRLMILGLYQLIGVVAIACSQGASIDQTEFSAGKAEVTEPKEGNVDGKKDPQPKDEHADAPTPVAGAFLVNCEKIEVLSRSLEEIIEVEAGQTNVGCAVLDIATRSKTKRNVSFETLLFQSQSESQQISVIPLPPEEPWHVLVSMAGEQFDATETVRAEVRIDDVDIVLNQKMVVADTPVELTVAPVSASLFDGYLGSHGVDGAPAFDGNMESTWISRAVALGDLDDIFVGVVFAEPKNIERVELFPPIDVLTSSFMNTGSEHQLQLSSDGTNFQTVSKFIHEDFTQQMTVTLPRDPDRLVAAMRILTPQVDPLANPSIIWAEIVPYSAEQLPPN